MMTPAEVRALIERVEKESQNAGRWPPWAVSDGPVSDVLAVCRLLREALADEEAEAIRFHFPRRHRRREET